MRNTIKYNFKTYEELVLLFERANRAFLKLNQDLLYSEVSERALCGALMIQIYNLISKDGSFYGYHVDVEYNRNKGGLKTICEETNELGRNRYEITPITCDLILHSRGKNKKQDNLIALEMKKSYVNQKSKNKDRKRLELLTEVLPDDRSSVDGNSFPEHVCGYVLGVYYEIDYRGKEILIEYYHKGKIIKKYCLGMDTEAKIKEREELFDLVEFGERYRNEMEEFYQNYFLSEDEMNQFFYEVFEFEKKTEDDESSKIPRRMMNYVHRYVSLATDIDKIRPGKDGLRVLFIKICMESLSKISGKDKKRDNFYKMFASCISDDGEKYFLNNFRIMETLTENKEDKEINLYIDVDMNVFFIVLYLIRNMVVHEGDYWSVQLFSKDNYYFQRNIDIPCISGLNDEKGKLEKYLKEEYGDESECYFESSMNYEWFRFYFVKACIEFIRRYIKEKESE